MKMEFNAQNVSLEPRLGSIFAADVPRTTQTNHSRVEDAKMEHQPSPSSADGAPTATPTSTPVIAAIQALAHVIVMASKLQQRRLNPSILEYFLDQPITPVTHSAQAWLKLQAFASRLDQVLLNAGKGVATFPKDSDQRFPHVNSGYKWFTPS